MMAFFIQKDFVAELVTSLRFDSEANAFEIMMKDILDVINNSEELQIEITLNKCYRIMRLFTFLWVRYAQKKNLRMLLYWFQIFFSSPYDFLPFYPLLYFIVSLFPPLRRFR